MPGLVPVITYYSHVCSNHKRFAIQPLYVSPYDESPLPYYVSDSFDRKMKKCYVGAGQRDLLVDNLSNLLCR